MKRLNITILCIFLVILSISLAHGQSEIRILYLNDFHGFAEPHKPVGATESLGGIAYLADKVEQLRREKPSLLLAAGDMIQGHNWANLFQGKSVIQLMNLMKFDAMVVGNHEFDFGQKVLRKRILEAKFPILGANVQGFPLLKPYVIRKLSGLKVALIGVVTADTPVSAHPRNIAGLKFASPEATMEKYLPELKKEADLLVVLAHLGHQAERGLAEAVSGIDVIIGGHSHTKILKPVVISNTIVVQAWEHAKTLGVLDLTIQGGKITKFEGHLEEIKPSTGKEDKQVQRIVAKYQHRLEAMLNKTIGKAEVDLDGENVKIKETNLGDLIADILKEVSGAEVAIINGGGIRNSIHKGEVKVKDVYTALPFDNYLVAVKLTGKQIREALEHGVSGLEGQAGRFPQVSGLTFTYSHSAPPGARVKEITIGGQPLVLDKEYVVATNDYLAAGGDGYKAFGEAIRAAGDFTEVGGVLTSKNLVYSDPGTWLRDLVMAEIKAKKIISPKVDGRSKALD